MIPAVLLQQLTGIEPLSIDQTPFRERIPAEPDAYTALVRNFPSKGPFVLLDRDTGKPWSAYPEQCDINVLLPPAAGQRAVESGYAQPSTIVHDMARSRPMLAHFVGTAGVAHPARRPLPVRHRHHPVPGHPPCVVHAHYVDEDDDAIAADRYAFMQGDTAGKRYLRPGRHRLRTWGMRGRPLAEQLGRVNER